MSNEKWALDAAKEIVIAKVANSSALEHEASGKATGEYFEQIYKKLLDVANSIPESDYSL